MATRTIVRKGDLNKYHEEFTTSGIFSPGHLLMRDSSGYVKVHDTAGGQAERIFAKELGIIGKTVDDAAASGQSLYPCHYAQRGDIINARMAAGATDVVKGDKMVSAGDGTLRKAIVSGDKLYSSVADSTAITNTSTATAFDVSYTLPAKFLAAGDVITVKGTVLVTAQTSTDTLTIKVKLGSTVVFVSGAPDVATNDIVVFECNITIRTIGNTGTYIASGFSFAGTPQAAASAADIPSPDNILEQSSFNTNTTNAITVTQQWSANNTPYSCTLKQLTVTIDRATQDHVIAYAEDASAVSASAETFVGVRIV